ncbi:MAG: hypothetical protein OXI73_11380 [Rhodospirillales bacterium]|nr:hypothetical protein [Rhodospirillales bacterium]
MLQFDTNVPLQINGSTVAAPILATTADHRRFIIALSAPLTPYLPPVTSIAIVEPTEGVPLIVENELTVRGNLPAATRRIMAKLQQA